MYTRRLSGVQVYLSLLLEGVPRIGSLAGGGGGETHRGGGGWRGGGLDSTRVALVADP